MRLVSYLLLGLVFVKRNLDMDLQFTRQGNSYVVAWRPGTIPMQVKLPTAPTFGDGTTFNSSMQAAMQTWNSLIGTVQFTSQQLKWFDWTRYSSRQHTEMNMGGLIGSVQLDMQDLDDFWPYLWLGQWTHAGKGTSMGMGAYTIKSTSLPNA